jgi:hypothetical protein
MTRYEPQTKRQKVVTLPAQICFFPNIFICLDKKETFPMCNRNDNEAMWLEYFD